MGGFFILTIFDRLYGLCLPFCSLFPLYCGSFALYNTAQRNIVESSAIFTLAVWMA